jgi:tetratricopeptide (TPR) repeat protein
MGSPDRDGESRSTLDLDDASSPEESADRPLARGDRIGRYLILGPLGQGAMGVVYSAHDPELDRKVAIKLVSAEAGAPDLKQRQARLVREAQAMARLSHPNVVAVFDVGTFGDRVFLAMELVEGVTLEEWLRREPRSWREIVGAFRGAGLGLAAAHQAGLVHRDFKPQNVLVNKDGRVEVGDFGLAREGAVEAAVGALEASPSPATRLTQADALVGTPAYMAPEQFEAVAVDARTDQFGFCVALYEALYGKLPFLASSFAERRQAMSEGRVEPPPKGTHVPAWIHAVLMKGLSPKPGDRYSSMDALLTDLDRDPARARRRWAGAALLVLTVAGSIIFLQQAAQRRARGCLELDRKLMGVWDDARRAKLRAAFHATGASYADAVADGVVQTLDRYGETWVEGETATCRERGDRADANAVVRSLCLDRQLDELRALTDLFVRADLSMVQKAPGAAQSLLTLDSCVRDRGHAAMVPLSSDPAKRARIESLQKELVRVKALFETGGYDEAAKRLGAVTDEARKLTYDPLTAEALLLLGRVRLARGEYLEADRGLREALALAETGQDDRTRVVALMNLVNVIGYQQTRFAEGLLLADLAAPVVERIGSDPELQGRLLNMRGVMLRSLGRESEGNADQVRALALLTQALGENNIFVLGMRDNLAIQLADEHRDAEAMAILRDSLTRLERQLGADNPMLINSLENLGSILRLQGEHAEAEAVQLRALKIYEQTSGPDAAGVADVVVELAHNERESGRFDEALRNYRRALSLREKGIGPDNFWTAEVLGGIGDTYLAMKQPALALPPLERAVAIRAARAGMAKELAVARFSLAQALAHGDRKRALALARDARSTFAADKNAAKELGLVDAWLAERR